MKTKTKSIRGMTKTWFLYKGGLSGIPKCIYLLMDKKLPKNFSGLYFPAKFCNKLSLHITFVFTKAWQRNSIYDSYNTQQYSTQHQHFLNNYIWHRLIQFQQHTLYVQKKINRNLFPVLFSLSRKSFITTHLLEVRNHYTYSIT